MGPSADLYPSSCMMVPCTLLLIVALLCESVAALSFDLQAKTTKCFTEELPAGYHVLGDFKALAGYSQFVDAKVTDSAGNVVQEYASADKGNFNFHTTTSGDITFCFANRVVAGIPVTPAMKRTIEFNLRTGLYAGDEAAEEYQSDVARQQHLQPIEMNLRIMEDSLRMIHQEYHYFKKRESEMRETNTATKLRMKIVFFASLVFMLVFYLWELRHLVSYFVSRKMINR
eukprot:NODE_1184_length_962_cov_130.818182_g986_i0.p2 GENE.NODE_1184_length_962_cov_130.818182_g986_i0~~NODE_1184_length_962_cov_130.818182_g986_i0.p2  ORF type:complete len:236 (-),score=38.11 NODE_1184_length_962_cov_130.818182_g986_i0:255-941(-)